MALSVKDVFARIAALTFASCEFNHPRMERTNLSENRLNMQALSSPLSAGLRECPMKPHTASGQRVLGAFILPPFQRPSVWTPEQKVRLIESIWRGLPIGSYVVNDTNSWKPGTNNPQYWLIDGQQRWQAIIDYVADEFPVLGYSYSELSDPDRRYFDDWVFPCYRTRINDVAILQDLYERLAYGGTNPDYEDVPAARP